MQSFRCRKLLVYWINIRLWWRGRSEIETEIEIEIEVDLETSGEMKTMVSDSGFEIRNE